MMGELLILLLSRLIKLQLNHNFNPTNLPSPSLKQSNLNKFPLLLLPPHLKQKKTLSIWFSVLFLGQTRSAVDQHIQGSNFTVICESTVDGCRKKPCLREEEKKIFKKLIYLNKKIRHIYYFKYLLKIKIDLL